MEGTTIEVTGIVRRRRNFSRRLSFFDVEEESTGLRIQLVVDGWEVRRDITAGISIIAKGSAQPHTNSDGDRPSWRLLVDEDGVTMLAPRASELSNPWALGAMHAQWRKDSRSCDCLNPQCSLTHRNRARWEESRAINKAAKAHVNETADYDENAHPKLASKAKHNSVFAEFILQTYSADWLRANGGVVEIAGGRGMLAEQLMLEHDIPVVLIEPKPVKLNRTSRKRCRKWLRKKDLPVPDDNMELSVVTQLTEEFYGLSGASADAVEACQKAALIIGMHPDEATGAIVDTANQLHKPFAVVPCCVFARKFSERRRRDGEPVVLYEDLLSFLEESSLDILRATLPVEGRNVVLWRGKEEGN